MSPIYQFAQGRVSLKITVRYYGFVSSVTKKLSEEIQVKNNTDIKELINILTSCYGYKFKEMCFIKPLYSEQFYFNINLNTRDINDVRTYPDGLNTMLSEGDVVSFGVISGAA